MGQRLTFWLFFGFAILMLYLLTVKQDWITDSLAKERAATYALLGQRTAHLVEVRATNMFTATFTNSGALSVTERVVGAGMPAAVSDDAIGSAADTVALWIQERVQTAWLIVFQVVVRLSLAIVWWPLALICLVPFVSDAVARRAVMASNFDHNSPHLFSIAMRYMLLALVALPIMLLVPYAMPPHLMPIVIFTIALAIWLVVVNFTKRA